MGRTGLEEAHPDPEGYACHGGPLDPKRPCPDCGAIGSGQTVATYGEDLEGSADPAAALGRALAAEGLGRGDTQDAAEGSGLDPEAVLAAYDGAMRAKEALPSKPKAPARSEPVHALARALAAVMSAEGGEPGPYMAQQTAWAAATEALEAYGRAEGYPAGHGSCAALGQTCTGCDPVP